MKSILPSFPRQIVSFAVAGLILSAGTGLAPQPSAAITPVTTIAVSKELPETVAIKVRQTAAKEFNVPFAKLQVVGSNPETWSDSCLGLGGPAEICAQALVEGWRVEVTNGAQNWVYRTDKMANAIRLEPQAPSGVTLPARVSQRLLRTVARQVRVPVSRLKVAEVRTASWDGCFGIYQPGRACIQIAIPGWQAIVTNGDRSWVYHLDQTGNRIAQNPTASNTRGGLIPSFIPQENISPVESNVVFQSVVSGDLTGRVTQLTLTQDGTITKFITAPNIRSRPVVVKRVSPQQVERFQQLLQAQRFPNLNNLRYLSSAAFADYPTTTFQGLGITTQYIDLEIKNLPRAFQTVIQAWEELRR